MKRLLLVFLLMISISSVVQAQEPAFFVVSGQDTARSIPFNTGPQNRDTLTVDASLGDTLKFEFQAVDWPEVNGYHMDLNHRGRIENPFTSKWLLSLVGYFIGPFLTSSELPTSEEGLIHINGATFQLGIASLGERVGSGSGHLGTLSVVVDTLFTYDLQFELDGIGLQLPKESTDRDSIRARIKIQIPGLPSPPKPITADFNDNGTVDFQDFVAFAQHFGRHSDRDDNFDSRIDLVENGSIDFEDFLLFASEFGKPARTIRFASKRLPR